MSDLLSEEELALGLLVAMKARAERAEKERDALREALVKCRAKFMYYAELHAAKGTPKAVEKAKANHNMATMIDAALAQIAEEKT